MVNYNNGKVYKIVCNVTGLIYVGSTTNQFLSRRLLQHLNNYKRYLNGKRRYITSFKILENNDYDIILLELVNCENKDELHKRERHYIETLDCVNQQIPYRTKAEYKAYHKQYRIDHVEQRKAYDQEYRKTNKDKLREKHRIKHQNNRTNRIEQMRRHYLYVNSWGGDPRSNNNLLKIDVNLFN
eukprot:SAG11_NODE_10994_length_790_cov_20.005789_1_plen_184_part_00